MEKRGRKPDPPPEIDPNHTREDFFRDLRKASRKLVDHPEAEKPHERSQSGSET